MPEDLTCEELSEVEAELALGVLPARQRARAIAHLDRCPGCRARVEQLTGIGDGLLGLLPGSEPPAGFESRVLDRLPLAPPRRRPFARSRLAAPRRPFARWLSAPRRPFARLGPAVAAVVLVMVSVFAGWAAGRQDTQRQTAERPAGPALVAAALTTPDHRQVGTVYAHPGPDGWLYMSVDLNGTGTARVTCRLTGSDGSRVTVGSFTLDDGYGYWAAPAPVTGDSPATATLTTPAGTVLASARLPAGHPPP